jgi:hypothetical protein
MFVEWLTKQRDKHEHRRRWLMGTRILLTLCINIARRYDASSLSHVWKCGIGPVYTAGDVYFERIYHMLLSSSFRWAWGFSTKPPAVFCSLFLLSNRKVQYIYHCPVALVRLRPLQHGSRVRIPLEAWMFVCVYSVYVLSCVQVPASRRADPPSKESCLLCIGLRNRKSGQGPTTEL